MLPRKCLEPLPGTRPSTLPPRSRPSRCEAPPPPPFRPLFWKEQSHPAGPAPVPVSLLSRCPAPSSRPRQGEGLSVSPLLTPASPLRLGEAPWPRSHSRGEAEHCEPALPAPRAPAQSPAPRGLPRGASEDWEGWCSPAAPTLSRSCPPLFCLPFWCGSKCSRPLPPHPLLPTAGSAPPCWNEALSCPGLLGYSGAHQGLGDRPGPACLAPCPAWVEPGSLLPGRGGTPQEAGPRRRALPFPTPALQGLPPPVP